MKNKVSVTQIAESTPFDNATNGFVADNTQAAIEELKTAAAGAAATDYSWGRSGSISAGTWLQNETVPSNLAGRTVHLYNCTMFQMSVSNEDVNTFTAELYEHDGTTYTLKATTTVTAQKSVFANFSVSLTQGLQLAVKIGSGTCKNVVVHALLKGTLS